MVRPDAKNKVHWYKFQKSTKFMSCLDNGGPSLHMVRRVCKGGALHQGCAICPDVGTCTKDLWQTKMGSRYQNICTSGSSHGCTSGALNCLLSSAARPIKCAHLVPQSPSNVPIKWSFLLYMSTIHVKLSEIHVRSTARIFWVTDFS